MSVRGSAKHRGGCVCGGVRYRITGDPLRVTICHCAWCQRRTGTAFAVEAVFEVDQVEFQGGSRSRYRHVSDESGRWLETEFCPKCGTPVGFTLEAVPGIRTIGAGTLDEPNWISSDRFTFRHVYARSRREWSKIPDGVDVFEAHFRA